MILKHLPDHNMNVILDLFIKMWNQGNLPSGTRRTLILLIIKPGKDPAKAGNYRPMALTSHLCTLWKR